MNRRTVTVLVEKTVLTVVDVMYQGYRPQATSQSDDNEQLRGHAHRLMAELHQLRNMHKQRVMNNHQQNNVSRYACTQQRASSVSRGSV